MIAAVILAAGSSSRLGVPKQTLDLGGKPVLQHVIDTAGASLADEIVVVLGSAATKVSAALTLPDRARIVVNPDHAAGQSSSLLVGLDSLGPECQAAVVLLGDQPSLRSDAIDSVIAGFRGRGGPVVQATYGGGPGHPVLFDREVWEELRRIEGDVGAREVLRDHPEWVTQVEVGGEPPRDLDTWEDYERLRSDWGD